MKFNLTLFTTLLLTVCISLSGCSRIRKAARTADVQPDIFPDYIGVTVPVNIAPLNFIKERQEVYCRVNNLIYIGFYAYMTL